MNVSQFHLKGRELFLNEIDLTQALLLLDIISN